MSERVRIPESEYHERIQKAALLVQQQGLDVLVVNSNEADYANVRYFSNFWPLFETAGVAISPVGKAALSNRRTKSPVFARVCGSLKSPPKQSSATSNPA
jgi:hypothetical protein